MKFFNEYTVKLKGMNNFDLIIEHTIKMNVK